MVAERHDTKKRMLSGKDSERVIFGLSLQAVLEGEKVMNLVGVFFLVVWFCFLNS